MSYLSLNCGMTIEINLLEPCREIYQNSNSLSCHHIELNIKPLKTVKGINITADTKGGIDGHIRKKIETDSLRIQPSLLVRGR